ncbi:hypothetical protein NKR19_g9685 [Coniochaeta hoffmannii]|uniref:Uncharacterized protein n=1 Tax=Coniochaeta hoffmannii TaxID=91930 RepID=A0AA38R2N3_9PEZI|nr:hypothetical protein NKR19_g9685 [Coniochaeta hoffmannii]
MAAPESKTGLDIEGTWLLNRTLSDDFDGIFALQGMSWLLRKILRFASMRLLMTQTPSPTSTPPSPSPDPENAPRGDQHHKITKIYQKQTIHPGGFDTEDVYILDGAERDMTIPIFGEVTSRYQYTAIDDLSDDGELRESLRAGGTGPRAVQEICRSRHAGWESVLTWGFEEVGGERRFTQNSVTTKGGRRERGRLVYDYVS